MATKYYCDICGNEIECASKGIDYGRYDWPSGKRLHYFLCMECCQSVDDKLDQALNETPGGKRY